MICTNHPGVPATRVCGRCGRPFCDACLVAFLGKDLCAGCKEMALRDVQHGESGVEVQNAGFGPRFLAMLIDSLLLAIPTYAVQLPLMAAWMGRHATAAPATPFAGCGVLAMSWALGLVIQGTYFTLMIGSRGQTLGKMALRLKVVRGDLSKMSYGRAFARFWGYQLSTLVFCIGYLMVLFTKDHRALHDIVCDTRVIRV